jgi:flagellar protein FliJ
MMKRFQFRLATLVRLRESVRDERRTQLADAVRVQAALDAQMQELRARQQEARALQAVPAGVVNVDQLLDAERYDLVLQVEQRRLEQQQATVAKEVDNRRQALVAADQDVRVLEKLRESQQQRVRTDDERQTMRELDEVAGRRAAEEVRR